LVRRLSAWLADFLLRARWNQGAARRYFEKSIQHNGVPETVTIDKSGGNCVGEQDHRTIKRITRPMLGFKNFRCARVILRGIEIMHMIAKGQMKHTEKIKPSAACQFYSVVT
jgi:putative transposase